MISTTPCEQCFIAGKRVYQLRCNACFDGWIERTKKAIEWEEIRSAEIEKVKSSTKGEW